MKKRNYFMVDRSRARAYYMVNATRSGTAQTVNYARNQGCKLFDLLEKQPERFVKTPQQQQISWSEQVIVRESYPAAQEKSDPEITRCQRHRVIFLGPQQTKTHSSCSGKEKPCIKPFSA